MSTPAPAPEHADDRLREQGLQLVTLFSAVIRIGNTYSVKNQVFRTQMESIGAALNAILERDSEATLVALDEDLYLNGVRIPVSSNNFRFHQTVIDLYRSRGISGLRVEPGIGIEDLTRFFELFICTKDLRGAPLIKKCEEAGVRHLHPALHASTEPVNEGGLEWDGEEESEAGEESPEQGKEFARWTSTARGPMRKYHAQALLGARSVLSNTSLTAGLEMRHAKRVVQPLVDGAYASEPIVVGLSTLRDHDEYTYSHSVNVCAVAVTMGHFLGMDRKTLADLGVAALLHDVGKRAVADQILHPLEAFTEEERAAAERHPIEGAKLLARSTVLNSTTLRCMRVALEHHASPAADVGYPRLRDGWRISLLSQIVAVADCYVSMHTRRGDLIENITPYQALGMMLGPLRDRFEPALQWALVQAVGFYPPGQLVALDDGHIALVIAPNRHDLARPHVRVIADADFKLLPADKVRELTPMPPERSVQRALSGDECPTEREEPGTAAAA